MGGDCNGKAYITSLNVDNETTNISNTDNLLQPINVEVLNDLSLNIETKDTKMKEKDSYRNNLDVITTDARVNRNNSYRSSSEEIIHDTRSEDKNNYGKNIVLSADDIIIEERKYSRDNMKVNENLYGIRDEMKASYRNSLEVNGNLFDIKSEGRSSYKNSLQLNIDDIRIDRRNSYRNSSDFSLNTFMENEINDGYRNILELNTNMYDNRSEGAGSNKYNISEIIASTYDVGTQGKGNYRNISEFNPNTYDNKSEETGSYINSLDLSDNYDVIEIPQRTVSSKCKKTEKSKFSFSDFAMKIHKPIRRGLRAYINSRLALNDINIEQEISSSRQENGIEESETDRNDNISQQSMKRNFSLPRSATNSTFSTIQKYDDIEDSLYGLYPEYEEPVFSSLPYLGLNNNVNNALTRRHSDGDEYVRIKSHDLKKSLYVSSELQTELESYLQYRKDGQYRDPYYDITYNNQYPTVNSMQCNECELRREELSRNVWRRSIRSFASASSKYFYETEVEPKDKVVILCNVVCLGLAFMVLSTAFGGTVDLQNTVNNSLGLGATSLMSLYIINIVSNLCLPSVVIRWLGCKRTVAVCFLAYIPFIVAQFDASYYTLVPGAVLIGVALGPIYCAASTYLKMLAKVVAGDSDVEPFLVRFLSIFYMIAGLSNVWGSIITTVVLSNHVEYNETVMETVDKVCGASFCPNHPNNKDDPMLQQAAADEISLIVKIYLSCTVIAFFIVLFGVSSLNRYKSDVSTQVIGWELLLSTLKLLKNRNQQLLIPIMIWMGMQNAFIEVDFSESFVTCALGLESVGPVIICYGLTTALVAILFGSVVPRVSRIALVCLASTLQIAVLTILFIWSPDETTYSVFFVVSILWAVSGGTWLIHLNALSGILFPGQEEESFSQYRIWEAVGFIFETGLSETMCISAKLYLQLVTLIIGTISYIALEIMEARYSGKYEVQDIGVK